MIATGSVNVLMSEITDDTVASQVVLVLRGFDNSIAAGAYSSAVLLVESSAEAALA